MCFLGFDIKLIRVKGELTVSMDETVAINRFLDDWKVKYTKGIKCPMPDGSAEQGPKVSQSE